MRSLLILVALLGCCSPVAGQEPVDVAVETMPIDWPTDRGPKLVIGRTDAGAPITACVDSHTLHLQPGIRRIVAVIDVGQHTDEYQSLVKKLLELVAKQDPENKRFIGAVIFVQPGTCTGAGCEHQQLKFPPEKSAYNTPSEQTEAAIWRFLAWFGADLVIDVHSVQLPAYQPFEQSEGKEPATWPDDSLATAVRKHEIAGFGKAVSIRVPSSVMVEQDVKFRMEYILGPDGDLGTLLFNQSPLRLAIEQRLKREPAEVIEQLSAKYGNELKTVMYQPALAVLARLRHGELQQDADERARVEQILKPYLDGSREALPANANGSHFAGHLIFAEWARLTNDPTAIKLVTAVAERGFDANGRPLEAMPSHSEMSDAVFMACPILVSAAELTGQRRYLELARTHLRFMQERCLRADGIYRHSPLCEAAWGRGNGFPALGLTLSLESLERMQTAADNPELRALATATFDEFRDALTAHLEALLPHQCVTGMWHQVIDEPVSYREMTATCMIGYALTTAASHDWVHDPKFETAALGAWHAVNLRVAIDGVLLDVCTGTGKQKSLDDYFNRTAILGVDERGGAMVLMFAMARDRANRR